MSVVAGKLPFTLHAMSNLITNQQRPSSPQVPPVTVEISDVPEIAPLTLTHLFGPMVLHALILALATLVWLAELCYRIGQKRKRNQVSKINRPITVVQPIGVQP